MIPSMVYISYKCDSILSVSKQEKELEKMGIMFAKHKHEDDLLEFLASEKFSCLNIECFHCSVGWLTKHFLSVKKVIYRNCWKDAVHEVKGVNEIEVNDFDCSGVLNQHTLLVPDGGFGSDVTSVMVRDAKLENSKNLAHMPKLSELLILGHRCLDAMPIFDNSHRLKKLVLHCKPRFACEYSDLMLPDCKELSICYNSLTETVHLSRAMANMKHVETLKLHILKGVHERFVPNHHWPSIVKLLIDMSSVRSVEIFDEDKSDEEILCHSATSEHVGNLNQKINGLRYSPTLETELGLHENPPSAAFAHNFASPILSLRRLFGSPESHRSLLSSNKKKYERESIVVESIEKLATARNDMDVTLTRTNGSLTIPALFPKRRDSYILLETLNIAIGLASLQLPPYVVLEIVDFCLSDKLEIEKRMAQREMYGWLLAKQLTEKHMHGQKIKMIINVKKAHAQASKFSPNKPIELVTNGHLAKKKPYFAPFQDTLNKK